MIEKTWFRQCLKSWYEDLQANIQLGTPLPDFRAGSFSFNENLTDPVLVDALIRYLDAHESLLNGVFAYNMASKLNDASHQAGILKEVRETIVERNSAFEDFQVVKKLLGNKAHELEFKVTQVTITDDHQIILN